MSLRKSFELLRKGAVQALELTKCAASLGLLTMTRLLAALLICILQVCQAHCLAEQAGLLSERTCACCPAENPTSLPEPVPCQMCDVAGAVAASPVIKCAEPIWSTLFVIPIPHLTTGAFTETTLSKVRMRPEAADPPDETWAALVRTGLPVRGPSVA